MYTLHNVNYIRRPEAVKSVNTAIIVFVYMIKFDKGAPARTNVTHTRHKPSIHILQPPPRSLTLSNAFLRLRRKKAFDGKKYER